MKTAQHTQHCQAANKASCARLSRCCPAMRRNALLQAQKRKAESAGDKELAAAYQAKLESQVAARKSLKDAAAVEANKKELEGLLDRAEELLQKNK